MDCEPYQTTTDPQDTEYTEGILTEVTPYRDGTGWSVSWRGLDGGSFCCGVPRLAVSQQPPAVDDAIRVYGTFGFPTRGIVISGAGGVECVYYRTPAMQAEHHRRWVEQHHREQRERFRKERAKLDADFAALPPLLQERIARFRAQDPDFRWQSEAYEMFCCTQAALLAEHFRTQTGDPLLAIEAIRAAQLAAVPGWSDGHSVNTHGGAVALAVAYLRHLAGEPVKV